MASKASDSDSIFCFAWIQGCISVLNTITALTKLSEAKTSVGLICNWIASYFRRKINRGNALMDNIIKQEILIQIESNEQFPVDFDIYWEWLDFSSKGNAKRAF
jgi:hypothetical protein